MDDTPPLPPRDRCVQTLPFIFFQKMKALLKSSETRAFRSLRHRLSLTALLPKPPNTAGTRSRTASCSWWAWARCFPGTSSSPSAPTSTSGRVGWHFSLRVVLRAALCGCVRGVVCVCVWLCACVVVWMCRPRCVVVQPHKATTTQGEKRPHTYCDRCSTNIYSKHGSIDDSRYGPRKPI
jgi:hypothetical protein